MRALQAAGVRAAAVMTNRDIVEDEHIAARGFMVEWDQADVGRRRFPGFPIHFADPAEIAMRGTPPLGADNRYVLVDVLGYPRSARRCSRRGRRDRHRPPGTMSWKPEVEEIERRRALAREMGGEERVARQHERGKLTARERVERLLDPGSFEEIGILADHMSQREEMKGISAPADGVVTGAGEIEGRPVYLFSEDFTVLGGSTGQTGLVKRVRMRDLALQERVPLDLPPRRRRRARSGIDPRRLGGRRAFPPPVQDVGDRPSGGGNPRTARRRSRARGAALRLQGHGQGHGDGRGGRTAARARGDRPRGHQGGARRLRSAHGDLRSGRQRGRRRCGRARHAAALPRLHAAELLGAAAAQGDRRKPAPQRRGAARRRTAQPPPALRDAPRDRSADRPRHVLRDPAGLRPRAARRVRAHRRRGRRHPGEPADGAGPARSARRRRTRLSTSCRCATRSTFRSCS